MLLANNLWQTSGESGVWCIPRPYHPDDLWNTKCFLLFGSCLVRFCQQHYVYVVFNEEFSYFKFVIICSILFGICPIACWEVIIFGPAHRACGINVGFPSPVPVIHPFLFRGPNEDLAAFPEKMPILKGMVQNCDSHHKLRRLTVCALQGPIRLCGSSTVILLCNRKRIL